MPRISKDDIAKECRNMNADELVFMNHDARAKAAHAQYVRDGGERWLAPRLNLEAARAVRHEEIRLGRSMSKEEQAEFLKKVSQS